MKQYARKCTGAENVNILDNEIFNEMQVAHSNHINKKKKKKQKDCWMSEEKGRARRKRTKNEKKRQKSVQQDEKAKGNIDKREKDEKNTEEQFLVAQRMLSHASNCLSTAIVNNNIVEIKVANELLHRAQQGYEKANVHREELGKISVSIGVKRSKAIAQLVKELKGTKQ